MTELIPGQIGWFDLTVENAETVKDFYHHVVGWSSQPIDMDGYNDHCMVPPGTETPVAGICHARGSNANLPPQWLIYITVADLDASLRQCLALGGQALSPVREAGSGRFVVIRDPAGAACALYQKVASAE
jgi:predicted enzyme related to lactoylglutathione lyase